MSTRRWLRMSWWNAVMVAVVLAAALVMAASGRWGAAAVFLIVGIGLAGSAVYARSGRASDLTRLNATEYADERDRAIATQALAVVGVVALVMTMVVFVIGTALLEPGSPVFTLLWAQIIVLTLAWMIANVVALRRS